MLIELFLQGKFQNNIFKSRGEQKVSLVWQNLWMKSILFSIIHHDFPVCQILQIQFDLTLEYTLQCMLTYKVLKSMFVKGLASTYEMYTQFIRNTS